MSPLDALVAAMSEAGWPPFLHTNEWVCWVGSTDAWGQLPSTETALKAIEVMGIGNYRIKNEGEGDPYVASARMVRPRCRCGGKSPTLEITTTQKDPNAQHDH